MELFSALSYPEQNLVSFDFDFEESKMSFFFCIKNLDNFDLKHQWASSKFDSLKVQIFWEGHKISTLLLSYVVPVKSKVEISQNFVAFSEYMNFTFI